jgi:TolA-binding protein
MAAAVLATGLSLGTAHAQTAIEGRVDRLEREMRAVQRKVFPGGAGQMVEPQITPQQPNQAAPGSPSGGAVSDLTARVNALESNMTTMTGQIEQVQYKVRQIEEAFAAYKRSADARLSALEGTVSSTGAPAEPRPGAGVGPVAGPKPAAPKPAATPPAKPDPVRSAAAATVERPNTGDAPEDAYLYGYRLWEAKFYPEAQAQLRATVTRYPKHRRASYAQNLLGRAYLDENKPSQAAIAFYESYQKMPDGERAPDSLFYLAQALVKLKKPASEVCKVYGELTQVYGDKLSERMKTDVAAGRTASKCK